MPFSDVQMSSILPYQEDLKVAFANTLGIPVTEVEIININELNGNTLIQFESHFA